MKQNKETIKSYYDVGDKPTQEQYLDTWDSFWHKDEVIPRDNIEGATSLITTSGRLTLSNNLNWVTNAEDSYGPNYYGASEPCGIGQNPEYNFLQLGHIIPIGYRVNAVTIVGFTDDLVVDDLRFQFVKRVKNTTGYWSNITDNLEFDNTVLYDGLWMANNEQTQYTGMSSRKAKRVFKMDTTDSNNIFNEEGEFFMYLKPIGTLSIDKYFHYSISIEIERI